MYDSRMDKVKIEVAAADLLVERCNDGEVVMMFVMFLNKICVV